MICRKLALLVTLPVIWGLSGCGGGGGGGGGGAKSKPTPPVVKEDAPSTATPDKKPSAEAPTAAAEGWGTIKGQIVWDGAAPEQDFVVKKGDDSVKDAAVCAAEGVPREEVVVNKDNGGLRWVIVYIGGKPQVHPDLKEPKGEAELGQKHCQFIPHVLAMRQGQKFIISSDDPITHNTKGDGIKNTFNPAVPPAEPGGRKQIDGPELLAENLPIVVACNIHPHMKAYIGVYAHPDFAVTDENGQFTIENVPAGDQKLNIWHEKGWGEGGKEGKAISVKAGETTDLGQIKYKAKS
jgi:hypothetical protein